MFTSHPQLQKLLPLDEAELKNSRKKNKQKLSWGGLKRERPLECAHLNSLERLMIDSLG